METIFFAIIIFVLVIIAWRLWKPPTEKKHDDQALMMLQNQISEINKTLRSGLSEAHERSEKQIGQSVKIVGDVMERLGKLDETNRQVMSFTDQLKNLQDILKNPKQRGVLGEYFLETVLKNVLPPGTYQLQYPFKDKSMVDAVIFYQEHIIPIDSKFSLENYNRLATAATEDERKRYEDALRMDLKTRIDETAKYIKPAENTLEFAFMFIPSEALYYDLLVNKVGSVAERDLIQYAAEKRVYPVSPTTFYAYLQMALQGIRQIEINKSAEQIRKNVGELQRHLERYEEYLEKIGVHLKTTTNAYDTAHKEFGKIDKDILKIGVIAELEREEEPEKLL